MNTMTDNSEQISLFLSDMHDDSPMCLMATMWHQLMASKTYFINQLRADRLASTISLPLPICEVGESA